MENYEEASDNTQIEGEPEQTQVEDTTKKTPTEASLTKEQKSKLDSFDRIYAEKKSLEEKIAQLSKKELPRVSQDTTVDPKVMVRLSKALQDFNEEEIDFIYRNSKDMSPESIIGASKDEWVLTAITARREKVAKENKIPESSVPQGEGGYSVKPPTPEEMKKDPTAHRRWAEEEIKRMESQGKGI